MDAQCQAIAGVIDLLYDLWQLVGAVADDMQYGAKYFLGKLLEAVQFKYMGGDKAALLALVWQVDFGDKARFAVHALDMGFQLLLGASVYYWAQVAA